MMNILLLALASTAAASPAHASRSSTLEHPSLSASPTPTPTPPYKLTYTAYHNSSSCNGPSVTKVFPKGGCYDIPVGAMSWRSTPPDAQMEMLVYSEAGCTGSSGVEHLDADPESCFTTGVLFMGGKMAKSLCIGCPF